MTFDTFLTAGLQRRPSGGQMPFGFSLALHGGAARAGDPLLRLAGRGDDTPHPAPHPRDLRPAPSGGPRPPRPRRAQAGAPGAAAPGGAGAAPPQVAPPIEDAASEVPARRRARQPRGPPGDGREATARRVPGDGGRAQFVSPTVARGQLAIDPQADPYRVKLPPMLARARMSLWALVRICVDRDGRVTSVKILKGADPAVDPNIVAVLSTWRYRPYTLDGRPVPFCSNVRYEISVSETGGPGLAGNRARAGSRGATGRAPASPRGAVQADINVTPLVDVVLVLLIIFMVVGPAIAQGVRGAGAPDRAPRQQARRRPGPHRRPHQRGPALPAQPSRVRLRRPPAAWSSASGSARPTGRSTSRGTTPSNTARCGR